MWKELKTNKINCYENKKTDKELYAYGSKIPLELLGQFTTDVSLTKQGGKAKAEFFVKNGKGPALLGRDTAVELGILNIGHVYGVESINDIFKEYADCFE